MNFLISLLCLVIVGILIERLFPRFSLWWKAGHYLRLFIIKLNPRFFKTYYLKRVLEKNDYSAMEYLSAFGSQAIPELLKTP
jgi:hypothetical protein